ncbi:hypothetical protein ACFQZ4_11955 [Catellatospora coxensis]
MNVATSPKAAAAGAQRPSAAPAPRPPSRIQTAQRTRFAVSRRPGKRCCGFDPAMSTPIISSSYFCRCAGGNRASRRS